METEMPPLFFVRAGLFMSVDGLIMKYLQQTEKTNIKNPLDGHSYVYYNKGEDEVTICFGLEWVLSGGKWDMNKQWANDGVFNFGE